jgi:S1-C subfamily serine protease
MLSKIILNLILLYQINYCYAWNLPIMKLKSKKYFLMNADRRDIIKKSLAITPLLSFSNFLANAYTTDEINQIKLYDKTVKSVCYISTEYNNINSTLNIPKGVGTGFIWDKEGHIVTNFHVLNKVDKAVVYLNSNNGTEIEYDIKLTGVDPDKDIAVIKIDTKKLNNTDLIPISLGKNEDIKIGQYAFAIGNPFGQSYSLSMGVISGKHRELTSPTGRKIKDIIQTDAAINPGNSGGVLIDTNYNLIGMNTATIGIGTSSGVNLAISIDTIKKIVPEIIKNGNIKRAVLGIEFLERSPSILESKNMNIPYVNKGVIVKNVPENSPCYKAGLTGTKNNKLGDVIIGIDNYEINNSKDLLDVLDNYKPNDKIKLKVLRNNLKIQLILDITLSSFQVYNFSRIEYEK